MRLRQPQSVFALPASCDSCGGGECGGRKSWESGPSRLPTAFWLACAGPAFIKMQTASALSSRNTKINWKFTAPFAPWFAPHLKSPRRMGIHLLYWLVCLHARRHAFKVSPVIDDIILWFWRSTISTAMCAKVPGQMEWKSIAKYWGVWVKWNAEMNPKGL